MARSAFARGTLTMLAAALWGFVGLTCAHGAATGESQLVEEPGTALVLRNDAGMEVHILRTGASIQRILVPDAEGNFADVVLGFDEEEAYADGTSPQMGSVLGRVAGRISDARFTLGGDAYELEANNGADTLHGGPQGFDRLEWELAWEVAEANQSSLALTYQSQDGEEGFPGNLTAYVIYTLTGDNALQIEIIANTDKPTPVSLASQSWFNLGGHDSGTILDHELTLYSDYYLPSAGSRIIPLGWLESVNGTAFDFTEPHAIGERIGELNETIGGYDHFWVLFGIGPDSLDLIQSFKASSEPQLAAELYDPGSGRGLEIWTTAPGMIAYTDNGEWGDIAAKEGAIYERHAGVALTPSQFTNAVNTPGFPPVILMPGEQFQYVTILKFFAD